jgi:hypothetical protein
MPINRAENNVLEVRNWIVKIKAISNLFEILKENQASFTIEENKEFMKFINVSKLRVC